MGKTKTISRSAVSGRFVKPSYAKQHPKTTVRERTPVGKTSKKDKQ